MGIGVAFPLVELGVFGWLRATKMTWFFCRSGVGRATED